tara:strand:+ start:658 stop:939 length:282 start_codon:yes stop_codon:yes gene_type:complete
MPIFKPIPNCHGADNMNMEDVWDICGFLFFIAMFLNPLFRNSEKEGDEDEHPHCSFGECRSLTMKSTGFCWKHQDGKHHISDGPAWWEEGGGS